MVTGFSFQVKGPFIPRRLSGIGYHTFNTGTVMYLNKAYTFVLIDVRFDRGRGLLVVVVFPAKEDEGFS